MKQKQKAQKQLEFSKVAGWGGKRLGSGRPNHSGQVNHMKRPKISIKAPLHITLRLRRGLPSLRKKHLFAAFKESIKGARRLGLYVIHFSVQSNHIHLFAEAENNVSLALGMRALAGRFAKKFRAKVAYGQASASRGAVGPGLKGSVFDGRYHLRILKTPGEVKNVLEYVLLNLSKHQKLIEYLDEFSSGRTFCHWQKLLGRRFKSLIKFDIEFWDAQDSSDLTEILSSPRSWLAQAGWMRACG